MKNIWLLVGSLALTLVAVVGVAFLFTNKANAPVLPSDQQLVLGGARLTRGNPEAKVTIVEFSDLQCPACKAVQPLINEIMTKASTSARLVFRQFPLRSVHKNAVSAAVAAELAANQGKFWEMHDLLYKNQSDWEDESDPMATFESYASQLGLDIAVWKKELQNREQIEAKIEKDEQDGNSLGVNATPTFYVNNVKTEVSELQSTVDSLLAQ